jgi:3-oxoacyl-[acyl-carrier-protein] synthase I
MSDVAVVHVGMCTPIGLDAQQTGFLLRAGFPALGESPLADASGEAITMAYLPTVDPAVVGPERLVTLATRAFEEVARPIAPYRPSEHPAAGVQPAAARSPSEPPHAGKALRGGVAVTIVLDEGLPDAPLARVLFETMVDRVLPGASVAVEPRGEGALGALLPDVIRALDSGLLEAAIVGGVHSDYDPGAIATLEASGRLFSRDNLDARIPGESAAFVLLMRSANAHRAGLTPLARILGIGKGRESARPDNDEPAYRAFGMTEAVRSATAPLAKTEQTAGWMLVDLTGEMWRIHEWEAVFVRTQKVLGRPYHIEAPAQRIGYLGAAAMPLFMGLAATAWQHGYAPSPTALCTAAADGGERAALVLGKA